MRSGSALAATRLHPVPQYVKDLSSKHLDAVKEMERYKCPNQRLVKQVMPQQAMLTARRSRSIGTGRSLSVVTGSAADGARSNRSHSVGASSRLELGSVVHDALSKPNSGFGFNTTGPRIQNLAGALAYVNETFRDDDLATIVTRQPNAASAMESTSERFFVREALQADAPKLIPGLADEQRKRGNCGVGFAMTTPRCSDQKLGRAAVQMKPFRTVTKEATWLRRASQEAKRRDRAIKLVKELRRKVATEKLEEFKALTDVLLSQLFFQLGYGEKKKKILVAYVRGERRDGTLNPLIRDFVDRLPIMGMHDFLAKYGEEDTSRVRSALCHMGFKDSDSDLIIEALQAEYGPTAR